MVGVPYTFLLESLLLCRLVGIETGAPGVCAPPKERRGVLSHCLPRESTWSLNLSALEKPRAKSGYRTDQN